MAVGITRANWTRISNTFEHGNGTVGTVAVRHMRIMEMSKLRYRLFGLVILCTIMILSVSCNCNVTETGALPNSEPTAATTPIEDVITDYISVKPSDDSAPDSEAPTVPPADTPNPTMAQTELATEDTETVPPVTPSLTGTPSSIATPKPTANITPNPTIPTATRTAQATSTPQSQSTETPSASATSGNNEGDLDPDF